MNISWDYPRYSENLWSIQEMVYYATSRFRAAGTALSTMDNLSDEEVSHYKACFNVELVCYKWFIIE